MTRRIDQEGHLFGERMRSREAIAAFKAFFARKKNLNNQLREIVARPILYVMRFMKLPLQHLTSGVRSR